VPSRKQRRRRQKERRHEYEYVYVDEQGEEVDVDPAAVETPAPTPARAKPKSKPQSAAFRGGREVPPPSWRRVGKRGLIFAPFMFLTLLLLSGDQSYGVLAVNTVVLLAFFLPFSYVLDSIMYRVYLKRTGAAAPRTASRRRVPEANRRTGATNRIPTALKRVVQGRRR
jgi:hypothetical protein